jgi:hypothetical protein
MLDQGPLLDDMIVATERHVDPAEVVQLLAPLAEGVCVETVLASHPLFWTRVKATQPVDSARCARRLHIGGVTVRYVASARHGSQQLAPPLNASGALPKRATKWQARGASHVEDRVTPGRWFMRDTGLAIGRHACGTGAGTRLALIDNDAGAVEHLDVDNQVLVGLDVRELPRGASHGAELLAWAVAATPHGGDPHGRRFEGVAPDASPRLYWIPKPGAEVLTLPLAIVRAVEDGADVVVCGTSVVGQMSPMLDDALQVASQLGRGGLGTAMVMPCGREFSSPQGSIHSSLSLGPAELASDPRVFCIGPSGRDGGWFLWKDRVDQLQPFANRGPALRWLAPGGDVAWPFGWPERFTHAESSGAAAMAAGVLLLVLGQNPGLSLSELDAVLSRTVSPVTPDLTCSLNALADMADMLPFGLDRDGHNAKHGYGRLNATRACLAASDPLAGALTAIGEDDAAETYGRLRQAPGWLRSLYSPNLAGWAARAALADESVGHAARVLGRSLRLVAGRPERFDALLKGSLLRLFALWLRALSTSRLAPDCSSELRQELGDLVDRTRRAIASDSLRDAAEERIRILALDLWPRQIPESCRIAIGQAEQQGTDAALGA